MTAVPATVYAERAYKDMNWRLIVRPARTSWFVLSPLVLAALLVSPLRAETYLESFDRAPVNWEGVNNRGTHFDPKRVIQDFGYSARTHHAGGPTA